MGLKAVVVCDLKLEAKKESIQYIWWGKLDWHSCKMKLINLKTLLCMRKKLQKNNNKILFNVWL